MIFAIITYAAALVAANLLVAKFGPAVIPVNAFILIGLDLALRDWLHVRMSRPAMFGLIAATGLMSWALNPAAGQIALASSSAFFAAAVADWVVFTATPGSWMRRALLSNVAGAAVDSIVFPMVAFGGVAVAIAGPMFLAKVAGGAVWALVIRRWAAA